ncbi:MAG: cyanophycinase [Bacteroidetes bacterium]|nr:MAG: cyanophycinase [Bacteroidota bacterium]
MQTTEKKGTLVLIGGAEDKQNAKIVLKKVWELNHAQHIVIIPTASRYGVELGNEYKKIFHAFGCPNPHVLDINVRGDVDKPEHIDLASQADLIFFTGGDQVKLVEVLNYSVLMNIIKHRYKNAGATIAGTSAGSAAASNPLIYDGDDFGFHKGAVKQGEGFGLLPDITVDTHFMERNRIPRLLQALASGISHKGMGVSEDTAAFIYPNHKLEVIGAGALVLINTTDMNFTNYHLIKQNEFIVTNNVRISFLVQGSMFDLNNWDIITDRSELHK